MNNREDYPYGYSKKGEKCYSLKSGKKTEKGKLFVPLTFTGSCNRDLF